MDMDSKDKTIFHEQNKERNSVNIDFQRRKNLNSLTKLQSESKEELLQRGVMKIMEERKELMKEIRT